MANIEICIKMLKETTRILAQRDGKKREKKNGGKKRDKDKKMEKVEKKDQMKKQNHPKKEKTSYNNKKVII